MPSLQLGIETTAIGMGIVFSVLIVLSIITWLLSAIVDGGIARKQARQAAKIAAEAPSAPVAAAPEPAQAAGLSAKTVAAITAAISAASGIPANQLRFTAIRRTGGVNSAWSASGTADIVSSRQTYL